MKWLALELSSLLLTYCADYFRGILGGFRKRKFIQELQSSLVCGIQERYENEPFYHHLDTFLSENKVISAIISNCLNAPIPQYSSKSTLVEYYIRKFEEQYPQYYRYHFEITGLFKACFDIIFNSLNRIDSESIRVVCNTVKELSGEMLYKINSILEGINALSEKFDRFENQWNEQANEEPIRFDNKRYAQYLARLFPEYLTSNYLNRSIYPCHFQSSKTSTLEALLKERYILLLGDAGYGKTFEAITLLRNVCECKDLSQIFPVFLPLSEFGHLYNGIFEGILQKLDPFCSGNTKMYVNDLLKAGSLLLILDGMDEINGDDNHAKFIAEIKCIYQQYNTNYFFTTSRSNQYHSELPEMKSYFLSPIDSCVVREKLLQEGISAAIPNSYYQLFENPLFFEIGKTILHRSTLKDHFNRTALFEKLFILLFGEWKQKKGLQISQTVCYSEVLSILGEFSYNTFSQTSYSFIEFETILSSLVSGEKKSLIGAIIMSGVFRIKDRVVYTHKLFKEYFAAYHLYTHFKFLENQDLYLSLINKREWKEVFIFVVGMYQDVTIQDSFLDFILKNNLPLYVDCVDAKSDLFDPIACQDCGQVAYRFLHLIFDTYTNIISTYFSVISSCFDPSLGKSVPPDSKICIIGALSHDRKHLNYWFDLLPTSEQDIVLIAEKDLPKYHKQHKQNAQRGRRGLHAYGINLELSKLQGDTGRKIGLDLIKRELSRILDRKALLEDKYLLCERVACCIRKIKGLQGLKTVDEIIDHLDKEISVIRTNYPDISCSSLMINNVDIDYFRTILKNLWDNNINFSECMLPEPDVDYRALDYYWTWDEYSDEQKVNRISKFFFFHQISYKEMVETNFPELCKYFSRYLDIPYQTIVGINLKKGLPKHDFYSEPEIKFYYVASPQNEPVEPNIYFCDSIKLDIDVHEEIRQSYLQQGKVAHHISSMCTGFTFTTTSGRTSEHTPLSDYVYASIKESLEDIFHKLP